ncbi:MAG TPA: hypothetical protein VMU88_08675 [bacterium]|nr:hypothetical protein [bacterium]
MKKILFVLIAGLGGCLVSCASNKAPISSPGGSPYPAIIASISDVQGVTQPVSVEIDSTSSAITDAAITLTGGTSPVPLSWQNDSLVDGVYESFYLSSGWTYSAGTQYTMTVIFGGTTYSASVTAPGGVVKNAGASGVTLSWAGGSNDDDNLTIEVNPPSGGGSFYGGISSPVTFGSGLFTYPNAGDYTLAVHLTNSLAYSFTGKGDSYLTASDQEDEIY